MKILWLSHLIPYPPKGGVLQRSYNLIKELSKYHEVDLLALHQPNLFKPIFSSQSEGLSIARKELEQFCSRVEFCNIPSLANSYSKAVTALKSLFTKDPYTINWLKSSQYKKLVSSYVKEKQYDAIHFDTISLIPYFPLIGNIPSVLDHHNIESHMLLRRSTLERNILKKFYFWQEGKRLENIEKKYCEKFSCNITCSDLDTERLSTISSKAKIVTIPNGVDTNYFQPNTFQANETIKRIIFIGRLNWYPNAEAVKYIAQEIWPLLKKAIPDIECNIIGANPPKEILELAKEDAAFIVHGFVDNILPFMQPSTMYVCPIKDGGGTKLKVLDALAMGMPLVAHPIACEGINVSDGKNVLFAARSADFVDKIRTIFNDDNLAINLGKNARNLILDEYSYESIGKKLSNVFENAVINKF